MGTTMLVEGLNFRHKEVFYSVVGRACLNKQFFLNYLSNNEYLMQSVQNPYWQ